MRVAIPDLGRHTRSIDRPERLAILGAGVILTLPRCGPPPAAVLSRKLRLNPGPPREGPGAFRREGDQVDLAELLAVRFIEQRAFKSWQSHDGAWYPQRKPLTKADIESHLSGLQTLGHYVVSSDNTARIFCFDIDVDKPRGAPETWPEGTINYRDHFGIEDDPIHQDLVKSLNSIARALAGRTHKLLSIPVTAAFSGSKGVHVYGFCGKLTPASAARAGALEVIESFGTFRPTRGENFFQHDQIPGISIEIYPKQDKVAEGGGMGNLLRLPLGINRKSGKRGFFIHFHGDGTSFDEMEPTVALDGETLPWLTKLSPNE